VPLQLVAARDDDAFQDARVLSTTAGARDKWVESVEVV
jgi:hypothetical protein